MADFQQNKSLVRRFYKELDSAAGTDINAVLKRHTQDNYHFRGMHPFYEQRGAEAVAEVFWKPLRNALTSMQRRQDIFMAGSNEIDGSEWVCSMGHLMGLFDQDWLGIPATGKMAFLHYAEFNRITDGRISETALFCDILSVMQQAGLNPLPHQTGAELTVPGPRTHDGLLFDPQDPAETSKTLALVDRMKDELVLSDMGSPEDELTNTWHDDMIWFGPSGIGSTYTLDRYQQQHQGPFSQGLADIDFKGHICRFAEGNYAGWFGWPNMTVRPCGGYMGLPASATTVELRVVDIYRRDGDKLAENWVFIDQLYFMMQQGVDVLQRNQHFSTPKSGESSANN